MDPVTALGVANSTNTALRTAAGATKAAWRRFRLSGILDPEWLDLASDVVGESASYKLDDIADIQLFLSNDRLKPVLSFLAVTLLSPPGQEQDDLVKVIRASFDNEVKRWAVDSKRKWMPNAGSIWDRVIDIYQGTLPTLHGDPEILSDIEEFTTFIAAPLFVVPHDAARPAAHLTRLMEMAPDLETLLTATNTADDLANLLRSAGHQPIFTHADVQVPADFHRLYVERTIEQADTGELVNAADLVSSGSPFRYVLIGSPGAGKTTFMRHLVVALASPELRTPVIPTCSIRCRDYVSKAWTLSLLQYSADQLSAQLSVDLNPVALEALLLLGKIVMVFDGLDEVTDVAQRSEMVQRIHVFTARFPAASIIVTSREVGYERAPLNALLFPRMRLQEFSTDQVEEYCNKWFGMAQRSDLVDPFLSESESVNDLRSNPLLLSLLCILYREAGTIPANRRGIYAECAQLLFKKWDGSRQIRAHGALPEYGDRLMQEIARWFYGSAAAQGGLEEKVITKVITIYMEQTLGFEREAAEPAASDFLKYCAGRAWLLGVVGSSWAGERLFAFTHRTFYEFFAAEAFARAAGSAADVCTTIREAFAADPTSVLPELLIQSFDQGRDRGAADVMTELCGDPRTSNVLLLRLMDGAILPAYARDLGFDRIVRAWTPAEPPQVITRAQAVIDPDAFRALMNLNTLARTQFVRKYLAEQWRSDARAAFLRGWASLQLSGAEGTRYRPTWEPAVNGILNDYLAESQRLPDPAVINWLLGRGFSPAALSSRWE